MHGYKYLRIRVCMDTWIYEYRFAWKQRSKDKSMHGYMDPGIHVCMIQRSKDKSMYGYMDLGIQVCM